MGCELAVSRLLVSSDELCVGYEWDVMSCEWAVS